jgi:hypothetical protein
VKYQNDSWLLDSIYNNSLLTFSMLSLSLILAQIQIVMIPINWIIPGAYIQCWWFSDVGWLYNQESKVMYVCSNYTGRAKERILVHEMWHYVWFEKLTESQRNEYKKEWEKNKEFYSSYSASSVEEWFAEDFYFIHTKNHRNTVNSRFAIVKKILRNF